jgi:ribosomal protein L31
VAQHTLTLVGRPGCHLCDDARVVVQSVLTELSAAPGERILREINIDIDQDAHRLYWDQIPVLLIDGRVHNFWKIDSARLIRALS